MRSLPQERPDEAGKTVARMVWARLGVAVGMTIWQNSLLNYADPDAAIRGPNPMTSFHLLPRLLGAWAGSLGGHVKLGQLIKHRHMRTGKHTKYFNQSNVEELARQLALLQEGAPEARRFAEQVLSIHPDDIFVPLGNPPVTTTIPRSLIERTTAGFELAARRASWLRSLLAKLLPNYRPSKPITITRPLYADPVREMIERSYDALWRELGKEYLDLAQRWAYVRLPEYRKREMFSPPGPSLLERAQQAMTQARQPYDRFVALEQARPLQPPIHPVARQPTSPRPPVSPTAARTSPPPVRRPPR